MFHNVWCTWKENKKVIKVYRSRVTGVQTISLSHTLYTSSTLRYCTHTHQQATKWTSLRIMAWGLTHLLAIKSALVQRACFLASGPGWVRAISRGHKLDNPAKDHKPWTRNPASRYYRGGHSVSKQTLPGSPNAIRVGFMKPISNPILFLLSKWQKESTQLSWNTISVFQLQTKYGMKVYSQFFIAWLTASIFQIETWFG